MAKGKIPIDRPLTETEAQGLVCDYILKVAGRDGLIQAPGLIEVDNLARGQGLNEEARRAFRDVNASVWTRRRLSEFVNRLIARGILSRAWEQSQSDVFYFLTEYGKGVLEEIASVLDFAASEFVESLKDPDLRARCGDTLNRTRHYDSMVRDAIAVLEDRLKGLPGVGSSNKRREVAVNALSPKAGKYLLGEDEGQQESAQLMFQGVLGFFGNPVVHGLQDLDPVCARQIVGFVDTLLGLLKKATKR